MGAERVEPRVLKGTGRSGDPPGGPPLKGTRVSALIVVASAAVVLITTAGRPRSDAQGTAAPPGPAALAPPGPLPSGAPERSTDPRVDDSAESGCSCADRGFGPYGGWRALPLGRLLVPSSGLTRADGSFRLLLHFHGAEPVRKQVAPEDLGVVVYALDAGAGSSAYEKPFASDEALPSLLRAIEREVALATGRDDAHAGRVALSSWSAGSGAVGQIVSRHRELVSAVILLDSLYAGYSTGQRALVHGQLGAFVELARSSMAGGAPMFLTYSGIPTEGYASTSEVASFLLGELGRAPLPVSMEQGSALGMRTTFQEGYLVVRGYGGETKQAHCEHLRHLVPALREVVLPALGP